MFARHYKYLRDSGGISFLLFADGGRRNPWAVPRFCPVLATEISHTDLPGTTQARMTPLYFLARKSGTESSGLWTNPAA